MYCREPKAVERHILVVETPVDRLPTRGDLENCIHEMDSLSKWHMVTLVHPAEMSEDLDSIKLTNGEWRRGNEYIYGPKNDKEKLEQNQYLIDAMMSAILVLRFENRQIQERDPRSIHHYMKKEPLKK